MIIKDIETNRLIIRSTRKEDSLFCLDIWLDEEMGKYLIDPPREKASEDYRDFTSDIEKDESWYPLVAISKETGELIGTCSLVSEENEKHWDLGYCVHKKYWRKGYATEMIKALIDFGYHKGGRIFTAEVAQENIASNAVLKKLGFFVEKEESYKKKGTDIVYPSYIYRLDVC